MSDGSLVGGGSSDGFSSRAPFLVFLEVFNSADKVGKAETCGGFQESSQIYWANVKRAAGEMKSLRDAQLRGFQLM